MDDIPNRLPSQVMDRAMTFMDNTVDLMVQLELVFTEPLNPRRLAKAIDMTFDSEPVLGCRFVNNWRRPYWERLDKDKRRSLYLTKNKEEYESFKTRSMDVYTGPQVKVCLWRSTSDDNLLFKVSGVVADASGVKEIVAIISNYYSQLATDQDIQLVPNLKGSRGLGQILRYVPRSAYPQIHRNYLNQMWVLARSRSYTLPVDDGPHDPLMYIHRTITQDKVARLVKYGQDRDATLDDVILTCLFRTLALNGDWDKLSQLRVTMAVDLRQYLYVNGVEGICNLSTFEHPSLGTSFDGDWGATLLWVSSIKRARKEHWIGLNDCMGTYRIVNLLPHSLGKKIFPWVLKQGIKRHRISHCLMSMGTIGSGSTTFGTRPSRALLLPTPFYPPAIGISFSGYAGSVTLSAGVYPSQQGIVGRLLDAMISNFPE